MSQYWGKLNVTGSAGVTVPTTVSPQDRYCEGEGGFVYAAALPHERGCVLDILSYCRLLRSPAEVVN